MFLDDRKYFLGLTSKCVIKATNHYYFELSRLSESYLTMIIFKQISDIQCDK